MCNSTVVHCKRDGYDVYIGRPSDSRIKTHFGNPFSHRYGTKAIVIMRNRDEAVQAYKDWLLGVKYSNIEPIRRRWVLDNLHTLKGKILGCWCKPLACHGDILAELALKQ